jgi:ribosomal protein S18 acetylase RimI-like enzyme
VTLIRRLTAADAAAYRDIRLEALALEPTAFSSDVNREAGLTPAEWAARLERNLTVGAADATALSGVATLLTDTGAKTRHRAHVVAVYVRPSARGRGVGRAMLEMLIGAAPDHVGQVNLSVTTDNAAARWLYERLGFEVYGTEPRGLFVDGRYYDQYLMMLRLEEGGRKVTSDE